MSQYRLSVQAETDLNEIWEFIAQENLDVADHFLSVVTEKFLMLGRQPRMGRLCEELGRDLRRFPAGSFIIFYRIRANHIEIARLLHGARDIESLFLQSEET